MDGDPRKALARLAEEQGQSLSALSRVLGRNVAYLQQYIARGTPRVLPERDRARLAAYLGVEEAVLGGPVREEAEARVPWLTVAASAGPGALAPEERRLGGLPVPHALLRDLGVAPANVSVIAVAGDSMAPTLLDGDRLLVDGADRRVPAAGGVFVIRREDALSVKRLRPAARDLAIVSDNPAYPALVEPAAAVTVIGRARLLWRGL
ncbi:S24 family peptidase [Sphingomonas corticis]|jgi:phage repressor protein C with HTH and peptisase S24 domain|uniref:S24 family peptidase n=1 Tax=Sphingomonas corticis TaxID=2722791 RepID=A0ABX1CQD3_9SPHN|nr:S24 family peptidase [Sphingomonas corticis]NJR80158.1 S24 family peptidase [Sphingomonas corticis]